MAFLFSGRHCGGVFWPWVVLRTDLVDCGRCGAPECAVAVEVLVSDFGCLLQRHVVYAFREALVNYFGKFLHEVCFLQVLDRCRADLVVQDGGHVGREAALPFYPIQGGLCLFFPGSAVSFPEEGDEFVVFCFRGVPGEVVVDGGVLFHGDD